MEEKANTFEVLFEKAGDYFETRMELLKLRSVNKSSDALSSLASVLAFLCIVSFAVIIISVGVALWIGEQSEKTSYGFFIVGGFYIVVAVVVYLFRKQLVKNRIADSFINKMLN